MGASRQLQNTDLYSNWHDDSNSVVWDEFQPIWERKLKEEKEAKIAHDEAKRKWETSGATGKPRKLYITVILVNFILNTWYGCTDADHIISYLSFHMICIAKFPPLRPARLLAVYREMYGRLFITSCFLWAVSNADQVCACEIPMACC